MIHVQPVGQVNEELVRALEVCLWQAFGREMVRRDPLPFPPDAFDEQRQQFSSIAILRSLLLAASADSERLLGLTEVDLYIPMLSFVFGQAQLNGRVALVSTARLRQEFYGLPADADIAVDRAIKETLHELGHTFGLTHCRDISCPMALSTSIQHLDKKGSEYCPSCRIMVKEALMLSHLRTL